MARFYTDRNLPPYAFLPGRDPHPQRHPDGYAYQQDEPEVQCFGEDTWWRCEPYRYGIDCFNGGCFWEAHVQWEACWIAAGKQGAAADLVQGLIQIAAAYLHQQRSQPELARRLLERGLARLPSVDRCCGIDVAGLIGNVQSQADPLRPLTLVLQEPPVCE